MAAHVFDSSEPVNTPVTSENETFFASEPPIYQRVNERRGRSPASMAGVALAALVIGGAIYASNRAPHSHVGAAPALGSRGRADMLWGARLEA